MTGISNIKPLVRVLILSIGLSFLYGQLYSQARPDDSILYRSQQKALTLADFRGKPKTDSTTDSQRSPHKHGTIITGIEVRLLTERGKTTFTILVGMNRNLSWIREKDDAVTLRHEQGHFDICEIYARILRKELRKVKSLAQARKVYNRVLVEEEKEHDKYDEENTFERGGITDAWRDAINVKLAELDVFTNPTIVIRIAK